MTLQVRCTVPEQYVDDDDLNEEGQHTFTLIRDLLAKYGVDDFQVVRTKS